MSAAVWQRRLDPVFDVVRTVAGTTLLPSPALQSGANELCYATRTPDGPATVHVIQRDDVVEARTWGDGQNRLLERIEALLGLHDSEGATFAPTAEPLRTWARRHPGLRVARTGAVFEALLPTILAQKVVGKEAARSYTRMIERWGEPAPGPFGLRLGPAPQALRAMGYEDFHPLGVERRRAEVVRRAAAVAGRLEEILDLPSEAAYQRLLSVPGIGPWTAASVMQVAWGDADAVPLGDYNLPSLLAWNLAGEPRADDHRMLELLEPYRGHRGRVVRLAALEGRRPPRYGPRLPFRSIERA